MQHVQPGARSRSITMREVEPRPTRFLKKLELGIPGAMAAGTIEKIGPPVMLTGATAPILSARSARMGDDHIKRYKML